MPKRAAALLALLCTGFLPLTLAQHDQPAYDVVTQKNVMIPMRDGVRLAANIYLPARNGQPAEGKFPVILNRTPYNKDARAEPRFIDAAVRRGYIVVFQDVRGRYKSEGKWRPIRDDGNDGFDTARWIGEQPWSDGGIGSIGTSYEGATQHAMAIACAPNLKAMVPRNAMSNFGRYGLRHNGAFELRFFNWVFMLGVPNRGPELAFAAARAASDPAAVPALAGLSNAVPVYARSLPLRAGTTPLQFAPDYEAWLVEAMSHGDYDDFWKQSGSSVIDHIGEYKDVPAYHTTGWYDSWGTPVANINYAELSKAKKSLYRLIIGPWTHSAEMLDYAGEAQFTPDAKIDLDEFQLRWLDRWLKGIENGVDKEPPVRIYVMGGGDGHKTPERRIFAGGHWRDENEWPLARTRPTPYYLHENGLLAAAGPRAGAKPVTYSFDPTKPVPTIGGNISSQGDLMFAGAADQRCRADFWLCTDDRPLSSRNDILVFRTPVLTEDMEVTGRLIVKLWASSNAVDTDFTAKLIDVWPPSRDFPAGFEMNLGDSIVRARYHGDFRAKAELLTPGKPYEFTIEMYPTSMLFKQGHRIRLDISSSNFPRFDVNPNTGEPLNDNRRWKTAENTIYMDVAHPSHIILPVIPATR